MPADFIVSMLVFASDAAQTIMKPPNFPLSIVPNTTIEHSVAPLSSPHMTQSNVKMDLVWSDEFESCPNGNPDPNNWGFEHGLVRNHEAQWYQPDNAKCIGGNLRIRAERLNKTDPSKGNAQYTSSSLVSNTGLKAHEFMYVAIFFLCLFVLACTSTSNSQHTHDPRYGRFEMRAKIDIRLGSWPAFWTLGINDKQVGWPKCGEVDIMEFYRGKVLANIMYADKQGSTHWSSNTMPATGAWASQFHVW
jgi:beta-glucanase (GH16 family)